MELTQEQLDDYSKTIAVAVDKSIVTGNPGEFRKRLGASSIGHDCPRYPWLLFRWIRKPTPDAQGIRRFNRGHREEPVIETYLRQIGLVVASVDPKTGDQFRITDASGHYGGSCDGICFHPGDFFPYPLLIEKKTSKGGASFNKLVREGVRKADKRYYTQICLYGRPRGLHYALLIVANKTTDELHIEIVALDTVIAENAERRAELTINAQSAPPKRSSNPSFFLCKMCEFSGICHDCESVATNCRSCASASPVSGGRWNCAIYKSEIPEHNLRAGCQKHTPILS